MHIAPAAIADLETLLPLFDAYRQFYKQSSDQPGARAYLQARLERHEAVVLLAWQNQSAVGFALMYDTYSSVPMKPLTILNDLYTLPAARGQGVATALIEACRQHALKNGSGYLRLRTAFDNHTAQRVYEQVGFQQDEVYLTYNLDPSTTKHRKGM